jgi:hypothetical protein
MKTMVLLVAFVIGVGGLAGAQQTTILAAPTDSVTKIYVGTWEGPYTSDHALPGSIRLVIGYDSTWNATMAITAQMPLPLASLSEFKITGEKLSWRQELMGGQCSGGATLAEGAMSGSLTCGPMEIPFVLRKK